jgi:hypothetical protein
MSLSFHPFLSFLKRRGVLGFPPLAVGFDEVGSEGEELFEFFLMGLGSGKVRLSYGFPDEGLQVFTLCLNSSQQRYKGGFN